jgi:serine-type D-Ala-D-Ala carboxypeptidase (penicillin-binding protein 5/6)
LFLFLILAAPLAAITASEEEMEITAQAAVLMDRQTNRVLWQKNAYRCLPMASTTKVMTAILALELGNEHDVVKTSLRAANTEGSSIWLEEGEEKTLGELLYGLMLRSGNDAAVAIAEHIDGSVEKFAVRMNEKAKEIGAQNTNFRNPHGLPADNHYSTAYDLALISAYALRNQRFREIISTPEYTISWPGREWDRVMLNQNRLLEQYPGGDGVKTGWTKKAGRCFIGSATRDEWQLLVVVLNAPQMWEDAASLLDYGFAEYSREKVLYQGQVVKSAEVLKGKTRVDVAVGEDFFYPLQPGERAAVQFRFSLPEKFSAPLSAGCKLGELEMYLNGELLGKVALHAGHAVQRLPIGHHFAQLWVLFLQ